MFHKGPGREEEGFSIPFWLHHLHVSQLNYGVQIQVLELFKWQQSYCLASQIFWLLACPVKLQYSPQQMHLWERKRQRTQTARSSVSVLLAGRCQLSLETSSEFSVRIFLRKDSLQKGYKRNEAQGSNSAVFTNDVYAILCCKTSLVQKLLLTK